MIGKRESASADTTAAQLELPKSIADPALVTYRSAGIGLFGVLMRFSGMPLEKIALFMNSSQVSGKGQFAQAVRLTFQDGALAPYRVVGVASVTAWSLQYSIMGFAFQFVDQTLSRMLGVKPTYYGKELMEPADDSTEELSLDYRLRSSFKTILSPTLAAALESKVSNRAEVQRYFGKEKFATIESNLLARTKYPALSRMTGPAFLPAATRNIVMCQTGFILTPITYKLYFPQEKKSKRSLFWYGLSMNIFVGNVVAITQQALWGRSLDMLAREGHIDYRSVIKDGLQKEGMPAFFTVSKWSSRVLMNAPVQGTLPWFYNEVLPIGEPAVLGAFKKFVYDPFLKEMGKDRTGEKVKVEANHFTASSPR
jgi:hypothetical protein